MYIITSEKYGDNLIWKYSHRNLDKAIKQYKELKKLKYPKVKLSEVIK